MPVVTLSESFLSSLAQLDASDAKRVALFLDKLVRAPEASSLRPEIVHDAADRTVRSLKVTHDLRAIAHFDGEQIVLLYVARHDRAYAWARDKCITCHSETGELVLTPCDEKDAVGERIITHVCSTTGALCSLLDGSGIAHDLSER